MNVLETMSGKFEGAGNWYDAQGKSMSYTVAQTNRVTDSGIEVEFRHDFADGTETRANLQMAWITPVLLGLSVGGRNVGNGYFISGVLKYYIKPGDIFVEVSYQPSETGLQVFGSSTKNAEGLYIAWHETLRRVE